MSASWSVGASGATASYTPPGGSPSVLLIAISPTHCSVIGGRVVALCAAPAGRALADGRRWPSCVPRRGAAAVD